MESAQELQQSLLVIAACAILSYFINLLAWKNNYYVLPEENGKYELSGFDVFGAFLTFFLMEFFIVPFLATLWMIIYPDSEQDPVIRAWLNYGAILVVALGILLYVFIINPHSLRAVWGEGSFKGRNKINFLMGMVTWAIAYPLVMTVGQIVALLVSFFSEGIPPEQVAVQQVRNTLQTPLLYWCMITTIIFLVPIIEETLFRGFLQNWLKKRLGRISAIFMTAAVFACFHFSTSQGVANFELLASLFILASFLGFIYERQQSLWASIGLHATFNAFSILLISTGE